MSGYKTFAVAGAGGLGKLIVEGLLEKKTEGIISSVIILSRSASGHEELVAKGAKVVTVDYASPSSVQAALAGVDVVVSTIAGDYSVQERLAIGAKAAGVKLFVPSEFGVDTEGATEGFWGEKYAFKKKLRDEIQLPYVVYYNAAWPDWWFEKGRSEALGFDFVNGKFTIPGSGDKLIFWVYRPDVARFVVHTLTALPKDKVEWRTFRIETEKKSYNQIVEEWKARSGKAVTVSHRSHKELEDAVARNPQDLYAQLVLALDGSDLVLGKPDEPISSVYPDWKPKTVVDYLLEVYNQ